MHAARTPSPHPVVRVAFSPCGRWLAAAQPHHGVTLYDRATGDVGWTFGNTRRADYSALGFLRHSTWLAAGGSNGLEVFDVTTGAVVISKSPRRLLVPRIACLGDMILATIPYDIVELVIPHTDRLEFRSYWSRGRHEPVRFSHCEIAPNGEWAVAYRGPGNPVALDMVSRREAHTLSISHREWVEVRTDRPQSGAEFAAVPRVAISTGKVLKVFNLAPAGETDYVGEIPAPRPVERAAFTLPPPDGWPGDQPWRPPFALTPDGRGLLVKRPRERVQLWAVDAGTLAAEWSWRLDGITCLAVAPDGLTAVAGARHGRVLTWDLA